MADILEKDLDAWDTSVIATNPFFLKPSEVSKEKYISGEDLARSIRITEQLKDPVELRALAYHPSSIAKQIGESAFGEAVDRAGNFVPNVKNWVSQLVIQTLNNESISKPYQDKLKEFGIDWKTIADVSDQEKIIEMLDGSVYPVRKYFKRILAESTDTIEKRKIIRELYNQSHGVDSEKWYNTLAGVVGGVAVLPIPAKAAGGIARLAGGSRYAVAKTAENVARGVVMAEEAGGFTAETAAEYLERTGDKTFKNFTPNDASGLLASLYGYVSQKIEFMGDMDLMLVGAIRKVGIRKPLSRVAVEGGLKEWGEEVLQNISRLAFKKIEGTDQTWAEGMKEALTNSVYALPVGGLMAPAGYYINRRNLVKGIKMAVPNITDTQAVQVADAMIDSAAESVMPNPTLRNNLRQKIATMYTDSDIENKEDRIDAITDLEYSLIAADSAERGIDIAENPLFSGEVNELGWFREGIPEERRTEIQGYINELNDLKAQLKTLNEAKEKDWEKIDEVENKLDKFNRYVLDKLSDLARADARQMFRENEEKYVRREKKKAKVPVDDIETEEKKILDDLDKSEDKSIAGTTIPKGTIEEESKPLRDAQGKFYKNRLEALKRVLAGRGINVGQISTYGTNSFYMDLTDENGDIVARVRMAAPWHKKTKQLEKTKLIELSATESVYDNLKQIENEFTLPLKQNRVSGGAPSTYRGAYIPEYRFIQRANRMDASTLSHELAHDWFGVNFERYRSGEATPDFMRAWGALEKALGVEENAKVPPRKASEAFARAYEGWIMNKTDWEKLINVEDKDKEEIVKLMQDYQNNLRDIYQDLTNPYFKQIWGKLGEMKPEIKAWFDKVVNIRDLDRLVERGEMTESQANQEKLNRAIDTIIESTTDPEGKKQLEYARTLNDTQRYEAEGGNKNALQRRIAALAQAIDENNMLIKENYDTHRDMLEVAKQADNFVRTRLDDALAIINGQMTEQEGLFKEDIYTALERLALENGDLGLLDELRNSEIANRLAKELGQRVAGFRNWNAGEVDVFSTIKSLDNKFNKALQNKKAQAELNDAERMFEKAQKEQDKLADKQLDSILKDMECK